MSQKPSPEQIMLRRIPKKATHIKMFHVEQTVKLLVINERQVKSKTTTADVYDLVKQDNGFKFWLSQSLPLNCSSKTSAINKFSNVILLTIPQQTSNSVQIYKYLDNKFSLYQIIISENVAVATGFSIGHRSFLAIGGFNSGIYQITKAGLKKEEIVHINFEEVTYYLPLPVKTYRDEVILLVQHHIDHGSHMVPFVKILIYSKDKFHVHDEIPCSHFGEHDHGATCLADPERLEGILGAAELNVGKTLGVVVPRHQVESGLFYFDWRLTQVDNPVAKKVDRIIKSRIKVEKLLQQQRKEIQEIKQRLENSLNVNRENKISGNWRVNTIVAPNIDNPNIQYSDTEDSSEFIPFESDFQVIADEIDLLQVKILKKRSTDVEDDTVFDHLKIDGKLNVLGSSFVDNLFLKEVNGDNFDDLVNDCVRRSQPNKITGTKRFKEADVENIAFSTLNNIPAENIAYNTRKGIEVQGNITFKNVLRIAENVNLLKDGKINDIDIKTDLVYVNSEAIYESVRFENLEADYVNYVKTINDIHMDDIIKYTDIKQEGLNLVLDHLDLSDVKISTKYINGQDFTKFVSNLCLKNNKCKFPGNVTVQGKVLVKGAVEINTLNGLRYPDEYVLSQNDGFTKITGKKVFLGNVSTAELIVNGQINGVNPNNVITRTTSQTIPGNFTFSDLEITESFRVDGDIFIGPNLTKFIPNPTLQDTEILNSTALFTSLEVDGLVIVDNLFNGQYLTEVFNDVVYKDEESVPITAEKKFTKKLIIHNNLNVDSNTINNVQIDTILTLDSEQTISNNKINGDVIIENLDISGLLNGEDLNKEFEEFIHLDSDEIISSEIIFQNTENIPDIIASELHIDSINNMNVSDFILTTGDRIFENVQFKSLKAEQVEFLKDIEHDIECFDIEDYAENRFSLSEDQNITGKIKVVNGSVDNIFTENINDNEWEFLKNYIKISDIFFDKFLSGDFEVQELHVAELIQAQELNNKNLNDLFETVFWINRSNTLAVDIEFTNDVKTQQLQINKLNNIDFHEFINDIVLESEQNITIEGQKIFENGFTVEENLDVDKINTLPVENILLKSGDQEISGHVIVHGNVWIHGDLNIKEFINEIPVKYLQNRFKMDGDKFILIGNATFQNSVTIDNLHVHGKANGIKPDDYLNSVVRIYDDTVINGTTIFKQKVRIHKNLGVSTTIDGVDINKAIEEVVFISSDDYIQGLVVFLNDVDIVDTVELETDLETSYLCGCDVKDWVDKAVYIKDGYLKGDLKFEKLSAKKNLNADIINDVNMENLIPLHTNQTINSALNLGSVISESDVDVDGFVNGYKLEEEYLNTVMMNKDQEIESKLIFLNTITITHNLKTDGLVDGKDLSRIVTTDTDQNLTSSYIFNAKVTLDKNLTTEGKVNNIDLSDWQKRTVTAFGNEQSLRDKWTVSGNVTFQGDVTGDGLIKGVDLKKLASQMIKKQQKKEEIARNIKNDYNQICTKVQNLVNVAKSKPFIFRHLEFHEQLNFKNNISAVHHFKYHHRHYLIVSEVDECYSSLYEWIPNSFKYTAKLRTGEVEQFITVLDSDQVYLVTKNKESENCKDLGTNVWIFDQDTLTHIYGLNYSVFLQKSKLPGTFYSLNDKFVTEYKLFYKDDNTGVHTYRQWSIPKANSSFNPRNFKWDMFDKINTKKIKRSYNTQEAIESDYEKTIIENVTPKYYLPATKVKEFIALEVGSGEELAKFTAVAVWEQATVKRMTDEIKIYEDFDAGKLFDKIVTYRPSNLNVVQFGKTGETFLVFLEDYKKLKVYEYKGEDGFKLRSSTDIEATTIISASLRVDPFHSRRKFLILVNKNSLTLLQAYMYGDRPIDNINCES